MFNEQIVQRFVDRLCDTIHYNVNVMNEDGIIVAARDAHRIGVYHELAHEIVRRHKDVVIAQEGDKLPPGVLPGVNVPVSDGRRIIGVVGVTGDYREVESVAYALKTSLETIVEYEAERERLRRRQDRKRFLASSLLYDPGARRTDIIRAMDLLGYRHDLCRVAVLVDTPGGEEASLAVIKANRLHTPRDITLPTRDGTVVVFKVVSEGRTPRIDEIADELIEYGEALSESAARDWQTKLACVCGSVQIDPLRYRDSYEHARWLSHVEHTSRSPEKSTRLFFERTLDYALALVPEDALASLLLPLSPFLDDEHAHTYLETFRALSESNMSIKEAAARLSIHRNTVVLRLQRVREIAGLDPLNRSRDRRILELVLATVHGGQ